MNENETTNAASSNSNSGILRRGFLRRIGSTGLLATAGVGLSSLLGPEAGRAATANVPFLPGVGVIDTTGCDACILCNRGEDNCPPGGGTCPSGQCCYKCQGCGYGPYTQCYQHKCNVLSFYACPGT